MADAILILREQQKKTYPWSAVYMVAEQLMDICRREPNSAAILAQDLENESMSISEAEKQIKAIADAHAPEGKSGGVGVNPMEAERALRRFYGLPEPGGQDSAEQDTAQTEAVSFDLAALMEG